jgi:hypothetical protein
MLEPTGVQYRPIDVMSIGLVLSSEDSAVLLFTLKTRFDANVHRHPGTDWGLVRTRLEAQPDKLWSLKMMDKTGGEPDVLPLEKDSVDVIFVDCSAETPFKRRSLCYDEEARMARKENRPGNSVIGMAEDIGIEVLDEDQYHVLQTFGTFDTKTSTWLKTPADIRERGGAIFGDWRFGRTFIYHNGADSYYASRGFRGLLRF